MANGQHRNAVRGHRRQAEGQADWRGDNHCEGLRLRVWPLPLLRWLERRRERDRGLPPVEGASCDCGLLHLGSGPRRRRVLKRPNGVRCGGWLRRLIRGRPRAPPASFGRLALARRGRRAVGHRADRGADSSGARIEGQLQPHKRRGTRRAGGMGHQWARARNVAVQEDRTVLVYNRDHDASSGPLGRRLDLPLGDGSDIRLLARTKYWGVVDNVPDQAVYMRSVPRPYDERECNVVVTSPAVVVSPLGIDNMFHLVVDLILPLFAAFRNKGGGPILLFLQLRGVPDAVGLQRRLMTSDHSPRQLIAIVLDALTEQDAATSARWSVQSWDGPWAGRPEAKAGREGEGVRRQPWLTAVRKLTCFHDLQLELDPSPTYPQAAFDKYPRAVLDHDAAMEEESRDEGNIREPTTKRVNGALISKATGAWPLARIYRMIRALTNSVMSRFPLAATSPGRSGEQQITLIQRKGTRRYSNLAQIEAAAARAATTYSQREEGRDPSEEFAPCQDWAAEPEDRNVCRDPKNRVAVKTLRLEDVPFAQQVGEFQRTRVLLSAHGAANVNALWIASDTSSGAMILTLCPGAAPHHVQYGNAALVAGADLFWYFEQRQDGSTNSSLDRSLLVPPSRSCMTDDACFDTKGRRSDRPNLSKCQEYALGDIPQLQCLFDHALRATSLAGQRNSTTTAMMDSGLVGGGRLHMSPECRKKTHTKTFQ